MHTCNVSDDKLQHISYKGNTRNVLRWMLLQKMSNNDVMSRSLLPIAATSVSCRSFTSHHNNHQCLLHIFTMLPW